MPIFLHISETGKNVTLIIGGGKYRSTLYRYEASSCIGDSYRSNGRYLKEFLLRHGLGENRNDRIGVILTHSYEIVLYGL